MIDLPPKKQNLARLKPTHSQRVNYDRSDDGAPPNSEIMIDQKISTKKKTSYFSQFSLFSLLSRVEILHQWIYYVRSRESHSWDRKPEFLSRSAHNISCNPPENENEKQNWLGRDSSKCVSFGLLLTAHTRKESNFRPKKPASRDQHPPQVKINMKNLFLFHPNCPQCTRRKPIFI